MEQKELRSEQQVLDRTVKGIENHTYLIWRLLDKKRNDMKTGNTMAGDDIAYRRNLQDSDLLNDAKRGPYFGKIETHSDDVGNELYYIGKQGVKDENGDVVVLDWRMPFASVFYNFTSGQSKQYFKVFDERGNIELNQSVDVTRKKEFTIKNQKITKIIQQGAEVESDLNVTITETVEETTITDDFLKEIIENSESTGYLKEIIATIQREQDIAIRQTIDKNVIIQGVAGSGKSSIALHRLSYLLFNNKNIRSENLLILGPSNLFLSSVNDLLPELNLEGIKQSTVHQFITDLITPVVKTKFNNPYAHYFEEFLFKNENEELHNIVEFKGSETLALIIDIYIEEVISNYVTNIASINLYDKFLTKVEIINIYKGYEYLPFIKRVGRLLEHLEKHFKKIVDDKLAELQKDFEFVIGNFMKNGGLTEKGNQELVEKMEDVHNFKALQIREEYKTSRLWWMEKLQAPSILTLYKQILSYEVLSYFENEIAPEILLLFKEYEMKQLTYFDLAPILYIQLLIYGNSTQFSHIVIDEAQDLSYMHFSALKKLTRTMTILGDKDQSIFMDYGQYDWNNLMESHFNSNEDMILKLETSYRSTKEIIEVANGVLSNQKGELHTPITALNRNGEKVSFLKTNSGEHLLDSIAQTLKEWNGKYKRIAIIHKDEQKSGKLAEYLKENYKIDVEYITPDQNVVDHSISVIASYNSKGMEFDAVILVNVNDESFPKDELHARLLYVLLTRAQQEVKVFYQDKPSQLLEGFVKLTGQTVSVFDDIL